jgi:hypothetical protein
MPEQQGLGGSRKGAPLEDEDIYPLTLNEYLTLKENLSLTSLTSFETMLLSTCITTFISVVIFWIINPLSKTITTINDTDTEVVIISNIVIIMLYGAIAIGTLICFLVLLIRKKKTKKTIERLDLKILKHLDVEEK